LLTADGKTRDSEWNGRIILKMYLEDIVWEDINSSQCCDPVNR
jgi:hypothetical protein